MLNREQSSTDDRLFLPNFCDVRAVFVVVVLAELLALVLVLAHPGSLPDPWSEISLVSLFVQWVALSAAALLCISRPWLARLDDTRAGLVSYLLILAVTLVVSEAAYRVLALDSLLGGIPNGQLTFLLRGLLVASIVGAVVLRHLYVQHQWKRNVETQAEARVQALQARIRPHFLFNSMNTIASLARQHPNLAESAVEDLADLFRASLGEGARWVSLADEVETARGYLRIEALRLGERLTVEWDLKDVPPHLRVPPLILQPLIENAVYHGIEPRAEGGTIGVRAWREPGRVVVSVRNPLPAEGAAARRKGNRMALENIRERLAFAYGKGADLRTAVTETGFEVRLLLPLAEPAVGTDAAGGAT